MKPPDLMKSAWTMHAAGAGLCALLTVAAWFAGVKPSLERLRQVGQQEEQLATLRQQAGDLSARTKELEARRDQVARSLTDNAVRLQPATKINRRLDELTQLAVTCQLKVDEIQPGKTRPTSRHEVVPIRLRGNGSYVSCVNFLHSLRRQFPDTGASQIDLKGAPGAAPETSCFEFTLDWYTAPAVAGAR